MLTLPPELCIAELPQVRHAIDDVLGEGTRFLVLDLTETALLTAAALRVFDTTEHRLATDGGRLQLRNPLPLPRRVLELTGFAHLIEPLAA